MGSNSDDKQPGIFDRIYGAATSGNPDVHSSLTRRNPNIGERAVASGGVGLGIDMNELARLTKNST